MSPVKNKTNKEDTTVTAPVSDKGVSYGMSKSIVLKPRMSEKAYGLSLVSGTYVFDVPVFTNKNTITNIIEEQFKVTVTSVRTARAKGKVKLSYQKRNRPARGKRADVKRAYVRLKEGDKLPFFEALEDDKKAEKKSAKKENK